MTPEQAVEFATLLRNEYFKKGAAKPCSKDSEDCGDGTCEIHNPITEEDVICGQCGEHSEMRTHTGTDCCGAGSMF